MTILGPSAVTGVSDTISRRMVFTCRPTSAKEEETCAADIVKGLTGARVPRRGDAGRRAGRDGVLREGAQDRRLRERHPHGAAVGADEPALPVPARAGAGRGENRSRRRRAIASTIRISASRLSFFLWGTAPDADLLKAASAGALRTPARPREAGAPHAGRSPRRRRCRRRFAGAVAAAAGPREDSPRLPAVPAVRRHARAVDAARDRAVLRQHRPRGSAACSTC